MNQLHAFVAYFGAFLALLFALIEPIDQRRPRISTIFFLGLVITSLFVRHALVIAGSQKGVAYLFYVPSTFAVGPLYWAVLRKVIQGPSKRRSTLLILSLLPAVLIFWLELSFFLGAPRVLYQYTMMSTVVAASHPMPVVIMLGAAHALISFLIGIAPYRYEYRKLPLRYPVQAIAIVMAMTIVGTAMLALGYYLHMSGLFVNGHYILTFLMASMLMLRIRYPDFLADLPDAVAGSRYASTRLDNINLVEVKRQIVRLMEDEKIYRDDSLRIATLASQLELTTNQLSRVVNEQFGKRFTDLVNHYRVAEAKELLKNSDLGVLEIAYRVGYRNISTFNLQFKKQTGKRPIEFRDTQTLAP